MKSLVEIVEEQTGIIRIQAGIINDLFQLLSQYLEAAELDSLPVITRINEAARLRSKID